GLAARDARGALFELAHQSAREPGGQGAHRARADGNGLEQLHDGALERGGGVSAQLRAADAKVDPRMPVTASAGSRIEPRLGPGAAAPSAAMRSSSAADTTGWCVPRIWQERVA